MIFGIGTDIIETKRFKKWLEKPKMLSRFFAEEEFFSKKSDSEFANLPDEILCQHYAARFAAKEAFSKALGTGLVGFALTDVFVVKNDEGKPSLGLKNKALEIFKKHCGNAQIFLSLSHEKEYATAFVVIEKL